MKYMKVMFDNVSGANPNVTYKLNEVNIADYWNPKADNPKDFGGFNFSTEDKIVRWLVRGDTLYDVEIPDDAEVIDCKSDSAPHGVFRTNKIILKNPRTVSDEVATELYRKSNLPEKSYFKTLAGCVIRNHLKTADLIIKEKLNKDNIVLAIEEYKDFYKPSKENDKLAYENYNTYLEKLLKLKNE